MAKNTDKFFELVERTFDIDTITPEKIMRKFYTGKFGRIKSGKDKKGKQRYAKSQATLSGQSLFRGLAERLAEGREVVGLTAKTEEFDELRKLRKRAKILDIHSNEATRRVEKKMTLLSKEMVKISKERREKRLIEEKAEKKIERIKNKIENAVDLTTLNKLERQIIALREIIDISDALSLLEGQKASVRASIEETGIELNPDF